MHATPPVTITTLPQRFVTSSNGFQRLRPQPQPGRFPTKTWSKVEMRGSKGYSSSKD